MNVSRRGYRLAVLLVLLSPARASAANDAETASPERLYHSFCSVCHGDRGDGSSHARAGMNPPPKDFTSPALKGLGREAMIAAVRDGRPGSAMAAWRQRLSDQQIAGVVDYIRARFMRVGGETSNHPGRRLYEVTCSVCHGDGGAGAQWTKHNLNPAPRDFTAAGLDALLTRERMIAAVTHGRPGTAMAAFGTQLSGADIEAVVDYIRSVFMARAAAPRPAPATVPPAVDAPAAFASGAPPDPEKGRVFYDANCATCHGVKGAGDGPRAYFIFPKPRNFLDPASKGMWNRDTLVSAIRRGVPGREMPAWGGVLDDAQIADVAEYVLTAFVQGPAAAAPTQQAK